MSRATSKGTDRVLVIGSGGREHALAWKLAQSPSVGTVFVAPGNGGTVGEVAGAELVNVDLDALGMDPVRFARDRGCQLTVVGPEAPLAEGLVDSFRAAGLRCAGPTRAAARLEASKAWSKAVMREAGVPTAASGTFTDLVQAKAYIDAQPHRVVVKASGLAAGKGVVVCDSAAEAHAAVTQMLAGDRFGRAGAEVVIEERLEGEEVSLLAFCDGERAVVMPPAQDHKRAFDGDRGPNTGGMGAYAPAPVAAGQVADLAAVSLDPILAHHRAAGTPFTGVLYAGLMLTPSGPKVLEYNVRFGDPETQVLLPMLDADLYALFGATVDGGVHTVPVGWHAGAAATVVAASEGYPGSYPKGRLIHGVAAAQALPGVTVFHAGTRREGGELRTSGGRVLAVTGRGDSLRQALASAYAGLGAIHFDGLQHRSDIGWRALAAQSPGADPAPTNPSNAPESP